MGFSILDIIIAIPLLFGAYKGFKKGLINEVAGIVALIAGIVLSKIYAPELAPMIEEKTALQPQVALGVAFAGLFVAIVIVVNFVGAKLSKLIKMVALGFANRFFGLVFGISKILLVMGCALYLLDSFQMEDFIISEELRADSLLYPLLEQAVDQLFPLIKEEAQPMMDHASDQLSLFNP